MRELGVEVGKCLRQLFGIIFSELKILIRHLKNLRKF